MEDKIPMIMDSLSLGDGTLVRHELAPFTYSSLPPGSIRVLKPESSDPSSGHAWRIETVQLTDELKFDALSYTWGSQDESFKISLNGRSFHAHHNLYTALPYLATRQMREGYQVPIWIDAICINQDDKKEIARQVAFMHQVYRQARIVWVWLGLTPAQENIPEAITLLGKIESIGKRLCEAHPYINQHHIFQNIEAEEGLDGLQPELWDATLHLLHNPWFFRIWV